jgi:lipoate-protein ligase A
MTAWRLLVSEPRDGARNMAVDEALLLSRLTGEAPPTVRFFAWDPPTLSLGYGQPLDERVNVALAQTLGVGLVRRPTGGSAVYHDTREREVTYSVAASSGDHPGFDDLLETYRIIGAALVSGLRRLGVSAELIPVGRNRADSQPTFCFARTGSYEVEVAGKKIVGSAQRRRTERGQGRGFLQHGSILLGADAERLRVLFPRQADPLAGMTTVESVLGQRPSFRRTVEAMVSGFEEALGTTLVSGEVTRDETALAGRLVLAKYGQPAWTERGQASRGFAGATRQGVPVPHC